MDLDPDREYNGKEKIKPQTLCENRKSDHVCANNYMAMHRPGATGPTGWIVECRRSRGPILQCGKGMTSACVRIRTQTNDLVRRELREGGKMQMGRRGRLVYRF